MTNEPIINARLKKFRENWDLNNVPDGEAFEKFVNSSILTQHQPDAFNADSELLEQICVGGPGDSGIDGIGIKVNGLLVKDIHEIEDLLFKFKRVNIEFIFIQSKYKPHFDSGELNNFIAGVRSFLSNTPSIPINEKITELLKLKDYLLSEDVVFLWENNPSIRMYYVAMGKWKNNAQHIALAEQAKSDIYGLKIYEKVNVHFIDSEALRQIIDSIENNFTAIIETIVSMELTPVIGVENSCISLCNADEFSKILISEENIIRKSLFDDNVRDFQGENTVNNEIYETIINEPAKFILLNNGITIVCDEFLSNNRKLKIVNPQIVNGCQTSHVIFTAKQKGIAINNVPLNIKIIATKDPELSNEIVRGTNRQNIVQDEAFESTKKFHKDLEAFFNDYNSEFSLKIYYERRSKQYSHKPIKQSQKFSLKILTQYFVGMFLNKPHFSHRHESFLLKEFANIIYQETQSKLPYFISCYSFYKLEFLFREMNYSPELKHYKAHLLMMFRESISGQCPNLAFEKPIDEHCKKIIEFLKNDVILKERFDELALIFKKCSITWQTHLKRSRFGMKDISDFTDLLLKETRDKYHTNKNITNQNTNKLQEETLFKGQVMRTMTDKFGSYCGFIRRQPDNIFFHSKLNKELEFMGLENKFVTYQTQNGSRPNELVAINVKIVN